MITVKQALNSEELKLIIQLRYRVLREPWNKPLETATDELEEKSINAYIADSNGEVIACGRLQNNGNSIGQIRYMAVDKDWQGKGLGKQVLSFLEESAVATGLRNIELQARENALEFYKQNGYTIKEKSFVLWDLIQHYLMEKKL